MRSTSLQPLAELIKKSSMASDISKYNKSWPHVTSSVSKVKRNQAARSNCSSSRRCHRSAHRGSTWFLLSHCKDRSFFCIFQILEQRNQEKVHFFYVESLVNSPIGSREVIEIHIPIICKPFLT